MAIGIRVVALSLFAVSVFATPATAQMLYGTVPGADSPLYVIDPTTGEFRAVGDIGFGVTGLAFHPITGELYGVTAGAPAGDFTRNLIRINRTTGAGTLIGPVGLGGGIADIAFRADGTLFGWSESSDDLITINLATGAGAIVGDSGLSTRGSGLTFDAAGTLYLAGSNGGGPLRTVDPTTGLTTIVTTLAGAPLPTQPLPAMKAHPVTDELWAANRSITSPFTAYLIKIDKATGVITTVATTVPRIDALAWSPRDTRVRDFDDDNNEDLLLRNTQTGDVLVALMNGATLKEARFIAHGLPLAWQIAGVGDLDGDGKADVVARHSPSGALAVALMNGTTVRAVSVVGSMPLAWRIEGVADLDGDGNADIVWRNTQTGDVAVSLMDGATMLAHAIVASGVPLQWDIQGANDLDGDGRADIVARNLLTGALAVVSMNGATILSVAVISGVPLAWQIVAVEDFNGDGNADIVWQSSGQIAVSLMDGATVLQAAVIASGLSGQLQMENVADLNGDGNADIVWRNLQTGGISVWFMNGLTVVSNSIVFLPPRVGGLPLVWEFQ